MPQRHTASRALVALAAFLFGVAPSAALAQSSPPYMNVIVGHPDTTPAENAEKNILALDLAMFGYYDDALKLFQKNLLAQHPVIMALFSNAGGKLILYRQGQDPLDAPPVPIVYQYLKSTGHSALALFELSGPHLDNPRDTSWVAMFQQDRTQQQSALDTLSSLDMNPQWRDEIKTVLTNNVAYMDRELKQSEIRYADLHTFARDQAPHLAKLVKWAAHTQVDHWMSVMKDWKQMLGPDFANAYGLSNTIYVARQNNVLFSVLAQFFGPSAMNTRLLLFETTDFSTTPDDMMTALTRVVADRSVGMEFFGNYYLMDYELMGGNARDAIIDNDKRLGIAENLPPLVPFGSQQWPMRVTPGVGPGSIQQLEADGL